MASPLEATDRGCQCPHSALNLCLALAHLARAKGWRFWPLAEAGNVRFSAVQFNLLVMEPALSMRTHCGGSRSDRFSGVGVLLRHLAAKRFERVRGSLVRNANLDCL